VNIRNASKLDPYDSCYFFSSFLYPSSSIDTRKYPLFLPDHVISH
jgi:hypothetical protein